MLDMTQVKKLYELNPVRILRILTFCIFFSFLFYVYMGWPGKVKVADYENAESDSVIDSIKERHSSTTVSGWCIVKGQAASMQLKREIVLMSSKSAYSYPMQYIDRPDVAVFYKDDNYKRSGFAVQINNSFIEKGRYKLYTTYIYDNKKYISDLKKEIQIP